MKLKSFIVVFLFIQLSLLGQELPPIEVFMPENYGAEDQNWAISQGENEAVYFANNKGLLTYNGARWKLYESPNASIIRSVKVIDGKIYTGCYMDFGFWEKDEFGSLQYTSLAINKNISLAEDEEFWNILKLDRWILFQSLDRIYIYDTTDQSFNIINSETTIIKIYNVNNSIYFQKINQGIYKFENGEEILVTNHQSLKDRIVVNIFNSNNKLLFQTKEDGFFVMGNDDSIRPWDSNLNTQLIQYSIYNSIQLKNGGYLLGTVSNGIIHVSSEKKITYQINQSTGLGNNTILSLFEDNNGNVWLGSDHGINNINFNAPFRVYKDDLGQLGTVYTTFIDNDIFYLGTNQGLFYKNHNVEGAFKLIKGTEGQVWSIQRLKNTIFCGHDKGTFIINSGVAKKISDAEGTWKIKEIESKPNLLIQGNYNGLYILENTNNTWKLRNKLKGFDISSRHFESINENEFLVSHEHKGVYALKIDADYNQVVSYSKTEVDKSIKSSLIKYNGKVLYGTNQGVFSYDTSSSRFIKDSVLSNLYHSKGYTSGKLVSTNTKLFAFTNHNIKYAQRGTLSSKYELLSIPIPSSVRETKDGYENILHIGDDKYLIGTTGGYIISDLNTRNQIEHLIKLNTISSHTINGQPTLLNLNEETELKNNENHLKISFSVSDYSKYLPSLYQYRLIGFNENWSEWSTKSEAYFENLPYGEYTFEAKGKLGDYETTNTVHYTFTIERPWYLKPIAIVFYFFAGFLIVVIIHLLNRNYYKNQRKKLLEQKEKEFEIKQLENEQQLMHFKNLDLQKDIEGKNRELGLSTMNLIKRNELLSTIKKELGSVKKQEDIMNVVKLINKNLNTTDDWKLFEEAFESADKGFIKKLKTEHSNLTSNDLRLCTYLRLNLSSKEIAPLLNISIRSVEVKRYRLRKKLNLPHESSLTNYILEI
jgi:ligand-binding sensor domain-containing protein/DNA-binding CsgD family transcriptional regulator